jgi:hypothetical protein
MLNSFYALEGRYHHCLRIHFNGQTMNRTRLQTRRRVRYPKTKMDVLGISKTEFTLFKASRSSQTQIEQVAETKELEIIFNLLVFEISETNERLINTIDTQAEYLATSLVNTLEERTERLKETYDDAVKRVQNASRSSLANEIKIMWQTYEVLLLTLILE